jgi:predicted ester cyclase
MGATTMTKADLSDIYRDYIACLNKQDWPNLGQFVHEEVHYNGERIGLSGYREMLEGDFRAIPDLYFDIHLLISEPPRVASRLRFDCTPKGILFGLHVNGKRVSFTENVFYKFSRRTDRESMVSHRQGRYRISALVRKLLLLLTHWRNIPRPFTLI